MAETDLDRSLLDLEFAILHVVYTPQPNNVKIPPKISQEVIEFGSSSEARLLKDSINRAIDRSNLSITFDKKSGTPVEIVDLFNKLSRKNISKIEQKQLILEKSKIFANILNEAQDARSPTGVFTLIYGHSDLNQVLILAKLEEHSGLQVNEIIEKNESKLNLKVVEHLIGLRGANIFKVGLFFCGPKKDDTDELEIQGILADTQIQDEKKVAEFYYKDFLGCRFVHDSKQQTREFYDCTLDLIAETIASPLEQIRARNNLSSFISSEFELLEPKQFIQMFVPVANQTKFESCYTKRNIEINGFKKDFTQIKRELAKEKIIFEDGISISGASSNFVSDITDIETTDGVTKITIKSKIRSLPKRIKEKRQKSESKTKKLATERPKIH